MHSLYRHTHGIHHNDKNTSINQSYSDIDGWCLKHAWYLSFFLFFICLFCCYLRCYCVEILCVHIFIIYFVIELVVCACWIIQLSLLTCLWLRFCNMNNLVNDITEHYFFPFLIYCLNCCSSGQECALAMIFLK